MSKKLQLALEDRLKELKEAQTHRAVSIENHLKTYEKSLRIRNVDEYIALSNHQRRCAGLETGKSLSVKDGDRILEVKWQD